MKIHVAHSPDSDDAFMFYALAEGLIDTEGLEYVHELQDIESLNRRALKAELEVSAVSIHAYAYLADQYALLSSGASMTVTWYAGSKELKFAGPARLKVEAGGIKVVQGGAAQERAVTEEKVAATKKLPPRLGQAAINMRSLKPMTPEQERAREKLRPADNAPFSEWVMYAMGLEQIGLTGEAKGVWRKLSAQRPDDLQALAQALAGVPATQVASPAGAAQAPRFAESHHSDGIDIDVSMSMLPSPPQREGQPVSQQRPVRTAPSSPYDVAVQVAPPPSSPRSAPNQTSELAALKARLEADLVPEQADRVGPDRRAHLGVHGRQALADDLEHLGSRHPPSGDERRRDPPALHPGGDLRPCTVDDHYRPVDLGEGGLDGVGRRPAGRSSRAAFPVSGDPGGRLRRGAIRGRRNDAGLAPAASGSRAGRGRRRRGRG